MRQQKRKKRQNKFGQKKGNKKNESNLIVQTTLHVERKILWVENSGCSNLKVGDKKKVFQLEDWNCSMTFGDNSSIKIKGKGTLSIDGKLKAHDVYYVEAQKHNLLSVSLMCDKGYKFTFDSKGSEIRECNGQLVEEGKRIDRNVYNLKECFEPQCIMGQVSENWLWHRRLGHINFDNLVKVRKIGHVRHIPQIIKPASTFSDDCQRGKNAKLSFKTKEYSTTRPLELVHTDLCGSTRTKVQNGEKYFMLLIDDFSRKRWVTFLQDKSQDFEIFKIFKKMVEKESGYKLKCLRSECGGEFTSNEFKD